MKYRLLEWLACPECRFPDLALEIRKSATDEIWYGAWGRDEADLPGLDIEKRSLVDIVEGQLDCPQCGASYPITRGIPRMLPHGSEAGPASGHRWTQFNGADPEYQANFNDMTAPMGPKDYLGRVVLDAGCGFGRHAFYAARYGAEVVALDYSADAVASAQANCAALPRVHVVQGDIRRAPFRQEAFDGIFCFGVLHHMSHPRDGFRALHPLLKPSGRLQVWVYGPRHGSLKITSGALHGAAAGLEDEGLHQLSRGLARTLRVFSHTPHRLLRNVPVLGRVTSHLPTHDHHKWPFDVVVADIYDRLRVPVTAYITGEELELWFADEGYANIQVTRRVRNNESFRGLGTRR